MSAEIHFREFGYTSYQCYNEIKNYTSLIKHIIIKIAVKDQTEKVNILERNCSQNILTPENRCQKRSQ